MGEESLWFTLLSFLITLGILITVHEFGHFWVARSLGVKVLRFSVGFGKPLIKWLSKKDNTEFVIAVLPLGGYVKMLDEREGPVPRHEVHRAFNQQSLKTRFAIVFAGPLFNLLFAVIAYWLMYVMGVPGLKPVVGPVAPQSLAAQSGLRNQDTIVAIDGEETPTWEVAYFLLLRKMINRENSTFTLQAENENPRQINIDFKDTNLGQNPGQEMESIGIQPWRVAVPAILGEIVNNGVAQKANLQSGDKILTVNGKKILQWEDWVDIIRKSPEQLLKLEVEKSDGSVRLVELIPTRVETKQGIIGKIGVGPQLPKIPDDMQRIHQLNVIPALGKAIVQCWRMTLLNFQMLGKLVVGQISLDNLSGPIRIAQAAGQTASRGLTTFLSFLALVSIGLAVINLLPIPILDGGHLAFYVIEAIKGSPLSDAIQMQAQRVGVVILLMLMSLAFYNDLTAVF